MAQVFDFASNFRRHVREHGCAVRVRALPVTPERECPLPYAECLEAHDANSHARVCDGCDADMALHVRACEHGRVRIHRCPNCGAERRYASALAPVR